LDSISEGILSDLKELLFLSEYLIKCEKYKKERKMIKKMIKKMENEGLESLLSDGEDYDSEGI
jgi:peroxiredoxin family protein